MALTQRHKAGPAPSEFATGPVQLALLVVAEGFPLIGVMVEEVKVPGVYWDPCRDLHEFLR